LFNADIAVAQLTLLHHMNAFFAWIFYRGEGVGYIGFRDVFFNPPPKHFVLLPLKVGVIKKAQKKRTEKTALQVQ
jgi:hypothetical protein